MKKDNISGIYLDIGGRSVDCRRIIGIFDMDNATTEKATVEFLGGCQRRGQLENLCADIPVSFVVCDDITLLSPSSGRTLARTVNR